MYHQGTVRGSAVRAASLLALAGAGLFGLAATAGAAGTTTGAAGTTTGAAGPTGAIPVGYSCSLAAYGQSLAPLNIPAALSAESTGPTVTVKLVTQPVQVPAATASALPQLSYLDIAGTASANGMSGTAVHLSGQSGYLGTTTGSMTQLPAMTASGSATQTGSGPAAVEVPPILTLTPVASARGLRRARLRRARLRRARPRQPSRPRSPAPPRQRPRSRSPRRRVPRPAHRGRRTRAR